MENSAYTYTKTTVRSTVVGKQYALCTTDGVNVREGRTEDARVVGVMKQNTLCYILADADSEWIFVESGDVRGFVKREYLSTGDGVENQILEMASPLILTRISRFPRRKTRPAIIRSLLLKKEAFPIPSGNPC